MALWQARQNSSSALGPEVLADPVDRGALAQWWRVQGDGGGTRGQLGPERAGLGLGGQTGRAAGEDHRDAEPLYALGEIGQEAQRVAVAPLAIVH